MRVVWGYWEFEVGECWRVGLVGSAKTGVGR